MLEKCRILLEITIPSRRKGGIYMLSISYPDKVQDHLAIGHDRHTHHQPKGLGAWETDGKDATRHRRSAKQR